MKIKFCKKKEKRAASLFLSAILAWMVFFPYLPPLQVNAAAGETVALTTAHGEIGKNHKIYCIDKGDIASYGIAEKGDKYQSHRPSEAVIPLTLKEQEYVFWGILTLQASIGNPKALNLIKTINLNAEAQGKEKISTFVSEEDLKALIYVPGIRKKYPWLEHTAANTEDYLKIAGLLGKGTASTQSGKKIPSVIAGSSSLTTAYQIGQSDFTIHFDEGGADADFIRKVPLLFSNDNGLHFSPVPTDGWTYTKTSNSITFFNPNPIPPKAFVRFSVEGTEYAAAGGSYASEEALLEQCLQIWECVECSGTHSGKTEPNSATFVHQRMVWLEIESVPAAFFAVLAGAPVVGSAGSGITFRVFRHEEDFKSTYNTQLYKYDSETGKPLENARFMLFERFDDQDQINTERDGPVHIYEGGEPYAGCHTDHPVIWDGFRKAGSVITDENGHASQTAEHGYHYDKTFCDGHPAPIFAAVPEPEEDEENGETLNTDEIEAAKSQNREMARAWLDCVDDCEEKAGGSFEGVHFHWLMSDVNQGEIENTASSGGEEGSTPDGGNTSEPAADTAYEQSGCRQDMQETYEKFISLKYSYAFTEFQARDGYIRHDLHSDDLPVEIITTDSSENGANASFAGEYSNKEELERGMSGYPERAAMCRVMKAEAELGVGIEFRPLHRTLTTPPTLLFQKAETAVQGIVGYLASASSEKEEEEDEAGEKEEMEKEEAEEEGETEKEGETQGEDEAEKKGEAQEEGETQKKEEMQEEGRTEEEGETQEEGRTQKEGETQEESEAEGEGGTQKESETQKEGETEGVEAEEEYKTEEGEKDNEEEKGGEAEVVGDTEKSGGEEDAGEAEKEIKEAVEPLTALIQKRAETGENGTVSSGSLEPGVRLEDETKVSEGAENSPRPQLSAHPAELVFAAQSKSRSAVISLSKAASSSEASTSLQAASPSEAAFRWLDSAFPFRNPDSGGEDGELTAALFAPAYEAALSADSSGAKADPGPDDNYSHCGGKDGEGDAWRIYDHRTEGEFHINKKDLDLAEGESDQYSAYGDAQGDGTVEGAVYGLFAAEDISHPDGKTGTVYRANNLVAIAATDKNGDASFLVNTEAPGFTFDYDAGLIAETADDWAEQAPKNLYTADRAYDDYTGDGQFERTYQNNEQNNGNGWIGRPLLMGDYYVKELSRSEGYELSIGNRQNDTTNLGQDLDVKAPEAADGYAVITQPLYAEEQTSEDGEGAGSNEVFFASRSRDTGNQKYDIFLTGLPEGAVIYRKEAGTRQIQVKMGTGTFEKVPLTDTDGTPIYIRAENDYQYPRYNPDKSLMTREIPTDYAAERFRQVTVRTLDEAVVQAVLDRAEGSMTAEENRQMLSRPFTRAGFTYVKGKTENALRRNGKSTPKKCLSDGGYGYSGIDAGIFDGGVRAGEPDFNSYSGVAPGRPAAYTVYGSPVLEISIQKVKADGTVLTVGDAILSILDYYNSHPYYSFGGIDAVEETAGGFIFTIYAGVSGNPDNFMVLGSDPEKDSIIYHAVKYIPDDDSLPPRLIYAAYSNDPYYGAFGTYENYSEGLSGSSVLASAVLVTDAEADGNGNLRSRMITENVYYRAGELVRDSEGDLIQAFEYREITKAETQDVEDVRWRSVPAVRQGDGSYILPVDASYTDMFGAVHTNAGADQTMEWKAVLPEKKVALSAEEAAVMGSGFPAGSPMNSAAYYVYVKHARAKAYLSYSNAALAGDNTYIIPANLAYPGQEFIYQDSATRDAPAQVWERAIRQKVKIVKDIRTTPEGTYAHNTNAESGRQDSFTAGPGGSEAAASNLPGFRFKIYLKSNLERLYRNETGEVAWLDRDGKEIAIEDYRKRYPEKEPFASVPKLYTRAPHRTDSLTAGSVDNNVREEAVTVNETLYSFDTSGLIQENQNPGYTRLLETAVRLMEDGAGKTRKVKSYNYEKFFEAIQTANHDKWDQGMAGHTSFKPLSSIRKWIFGSGGGEKEYPSAHNNAEVENESQTSDDAKENAKVSDAVRQFAITWYLDEEVKKQTEDNGGGENQASGGSEAYQDEIYDRALRQAILKAENYLSPFFTYDLDEIYSISWDSEAGGGNDRDRTTLSADTAYHTDGNGQEVSKDGYYYGISNYLPYGAYVAVEQQPHSAELGDFFNKHYKTDKPKEIILPALYESGGNEGSPEQFNTFYEYGSQDEPEQMQKKYLIRMNEEWAQSRSDDLRHYVIRAHNNDGDFEVYKYGLDADKLSGTIEYSGDSFHYRGFAIAQRDWNPYKDVYETENAACVYRPNEKVGRYYRYGALSEQAGTDDNVLYLNGTGTDSNNPSGFYFKDGVKCISGTLTGYDGRYFAALVPWAATEPADAGRYDAAAFTGYADGKYRNTFYTSRLRIEKLDSETGENILHDGAVFSIYSAEREDGEHSDGQVKFYEKDTVIAGTKEFLEAMGAADITPVARPSLPWQVPYNGKYYGTAPAGTPICRESGQVVMADESGRKTGRFQAYTTTKDRESGSQNAGYLETPQPLGAGCYVLCELKAPAGYVRSRPVAIEVYSDEITYYLDGDRDKRVTAAIYEEAVTRTGGNGASAVNPDGTKPNGNKPQDRGDAARVYLNNTPIRLEVTKAKPDEKTIFYELNGRLEGSITELKGRYGLENLELAYNHSGAYLGYGWKRGFLDALKKRQSAGEALEILYEDGIFTGKARLKKRLETADDHNRYLPGAVMTLYDAIEIKPNGDREDYRFDGVNVVRDPYGNVRNIYIQKGFAGTQVKFVLDKTEPDQAGLEDYKNYAYDDQEDDRGAGTWIAKTVEREDTDILFYDLGDLDVLAEENGILYSHDREGGKLRAQNGKSVFALKKGIPFLEIVSPDYGELHYSAKERVFTAVSEDTEVFHLDSDGNRDSRVDPYTGMAYVTEKAAGKILVWPVKIYRDQYGNITAREKITTGRIATIGADTEKEWTIGTWEDRTFVKSVNPVLDGHSRPDYYQQSEETYQKGSPVYDRDGDYVRYKYDDKLKAYNDNAWQIESNRELADIGPNPESAADDRPLYHRQGESFVIENTWVSGEAAPNDPFESGMTDGQVDVLKRVPAGLYIMEELQAPEGYSKIMPVGLTVENHAEVQTVKVTDQTIRGCFEKLDAPGDFRINVLDRDQVLEEPQKRIEAKGAYSFESVEGVKLALFRAKRVKTDDWEHHPDGYLLEKSEEAPATWTVLDQNNQKKTFTAEWNVTAAPNYLEAIPAGDYILEETVTPPGYLPAACEITVQAREGLQSFMLPNDHTKLEIYKYREENGAKIPMPPEYGAVLALYEAVTDENGIVIQDGIPKYQKDRLIDRWTTDDCREYTGVDAAGPHLKDGMGDSSFTGAYEGLFAEYGAAFDTVSWQAGRRASRPSSHETVFTAAAGKKITVSGEEVKFEEGISEEDKRGFLEAFNRDRSALEVRWAVVRTAEKVSSDCTPNEESVRQIWTADDGSRILVSAFYGLTAEGGPGYTFDYFFHYRALTDSAFPEAVSYDTAAGIHRIDRLPYRDKSEKDSLSGCYVLVEEEVPEGFQGTGPRAVIVEETADIQLYSLENRPKSLEILKITEEGAALPGARLALYRADEYGNLSREEACRMDRWISGSDGSYTKADVESGKLPDGCRAGDLKPHRISPIPFGFYYLVEEAAPAGFCMMEPQRIEVTEHSEILVRATDREKKGTVEIRKYDSENPGKALLHAVFELKNLNTGEVSHLTTDSAGIAKSLPIRTGSFEEGRWKAYTFSFREVRAPEGYRLSRRIQLFSFADDGVSEEMTWRFEAGNKPTEIEISKSDFQTGQLLEGARLAVYRVKLESGIYVEDGQALEEWISEAESHTIVGKLSAGETYLLKELKAPPGYAETEPVLFAVSDDGRKISGTADGGRSISFYSDPDFPDSVEAISVWGRQAVEADTLLKNCRTGEVIEIMPGCERPLTAEDGLEEGELYEEQEVTRYTDGGSRISRRRIFPMKLDENGGYLPVLRTVGRTQLTIREPDGTVIESWEVKNREGEGYRHLSYNPEYREQNSVSVLSENGKNGSAVLPGSVLRYEVICKNPEKEMREIRVRIVWDGDIDWMPSNSSKEWEQSGKILSAVIPKMMPETEKRLILAFAVKPEAEGAIRLSAGVDKTACLAVTPVAGSGTYSLVNRVEGSTKEQRENRKFSYRVEFFDRSGSRLLGNISYKGSRSGLIKSGEILDLEAGEFVTFSGLAWGTTCRILETDDTRFWTESEFQDRNSWGAEGTVSEQAESAVFLYRRRDGTERERYKKNQRYTLWEETWYLDGTSVLSGRHGFALGPWAAVNEIEMADAPVQVEIEKLDSETNNGIVGAVLQILDGEDRVVEEWVSRDVPYQIESKLIPGDTYRLREVKPPAGYGLSGEIPFTIPKAGGRLTVQMVDQPVHVIIRKTESEEGRALAGALLELRDEEGKKIERWVSSGSGRIFDRRLTAGKSYTLLELKAPDGYQRAEPIIFTVPKEGGRTEVALENRPTQVRILKLADGEDTALEGAKIRIEDQEGRVLCRFVSEREPYEMTGLLRAGAVYRAVEEEAPSGYLLAEPTEFTVLEGEEILEIRIYDKKEATEKPPGNHGKEEVPPRTVLPAEGTITVHYDEKLSGTGHLLLPRKKLSPLPGLGDDTQGARRWPLYLAAVIFTLLLFLALERRKGRKRWADRRKERK